MRAIARAIGVALHAGRPVRWLAAAREVADNAVADEKGIDLVDYHVAVTGKVWICQGSAPRHGMPQRRCRYRAAGGDPRMVMPGQVECGDPHRTIAVAGSVLTSVMPRPARQWGHLLRNYLCIIITRGLRPVTAWPGTVDGG